MSEVPLCMATGRVAIERKHGLSTEQVPVSAYVGSSKNLKDLKDQGTSLSLGGSGHAERDGVMFL